MSTLGYTPVSTLGYTPVSTLGFCAGPLVYLGRTPVYCCTGDEEDAGDEGNTGDEEDAGDGENAGDEGDEQEMKQEEMKKEGDEKRPCRSSLPGFGFIVFFCFF